MKIKTGFLNKQLLHNYFSLISAVAVLISMILVFYDIPGDRKCLYGILFIVLLFIMYLISFLRANFQKRVSLTINNSTMVIKEGDLFEQESLIIIPFNEYFDTIVDDKMISSNSLNGIFINKNSLEDIEKVIDDDQRLRKFIIGENTNRTNGRTKKYKLGTICTYDKKYLLTAFTHFDEENRAFLQMNQYIDFLLNFWNEIDIVYSGRSVSLPLIGSGITRHIGYENISEQELLELIIWSFKVSKIKFTYPSTVSVIIHKNKVDKIDFFKLKKYT